MINRLDGLIGLAVKGRKVAFGSEGAVAAVRKGKAKLVIYSSDAADNTKKLVSDKCRSYGVRTLEYGTNEHLGRITGKNKVAAIAVCDRGLSDAIFKTYGGETDEQNK